MGNYYDPWWGTGTAATTSNVIYTTGVSSNSWPLVSNGQPFTIKYEYPPAPAAPAIAEPEDALSWLRRRVDEVCEEAFAA